MNAARDRQAHGHTDGRDQYTFRLAMSNTKCDKKDLAFVNGPGFDGPGFDGVRVGV